jgi:alpha-1,3/alpha-1,6-mannosyltransferase
MTIEEARKILRYGDNYDSIFVSLNRYERKKRIDIAIQAINVYRKESSGSRDGKRSVLIVAGGYDKRVVENVEYLQELETLCQSLSLPHIYYPHLPTNDEMISNPVSKLDVIFRTSISSSERTALFTLATGIYPYLVSTYGVTMLQCLLYQHYYIHPIGNTLA